VLPVLLAITFHELAHAAVAYRLGDRTAKAAGRLTLNPLVHIDLLGTVILPLALLVLTRGQLVFGYAKPVPINPYNFHNPRKGMALSAAAGPGANLLLALLCALALKWVLLPLAVVAPEGVVVSVLAPLRQMLLVGIVVNLVLASFNLLPVPPLDGGRVLVGLLPPRQAWALQRLEPYGFIIVIILIATGLAYYFIRPLMGAMMALIGVATGGL